MKKKDIDIKNLFSSLALSKKKSEMIKGGEGGGSMDPCLCFKQECTESCNTDCSICITTCTICITDCPFGCMGDNCSSNGTLLG